MAGRSFSYLSAKIKVSNKIQQICGIVFIEIYSSGSSVLNSILNSIETTNELVLLRTPLERFLDLCFLFHHPVVVSHEQNIINQRCPFDTLSLWMWLRWWLTEYPVGHVLVCSGLEYQLTGIDFCL